MVSHFCKTVAEDNIFNSLITGCIILASVLVGIQTYPSLEYNKAVVTLDAIVLWIFASECLIKMIGEGTRPYRYFTGPDWRWNNFDFVIVLLCMPFFPLGGGGVAFLRLLRLLRVTKLFKKVPQLQMLVGGMAQGLKSIVYIGVLLLLVFYLFAVMAVFAFGPNDPAQFGDLGLAFVTLFRCATLEDWTDVMYINMFGCDAYDGGLYSPAEANQPIPSAFGSFKGFQCSAPSRHWLISVVYFVFFITLSAFVVLSLFIGAITMGMNTALEEMESQKLEARAQSVSGAVNPAWFKRLVERAFADEEEDEDAGGVIDLEALEKGEQGSPGKGLPPLALDSEGGDQRGSLTGGLTVPGELSRGESQNALLGNSAAPAPGRRGRGPLSPVTARTGRGPLTSRPPTNRGTSAALWRWRARRGWRRWSRGCRHLAEHPRFQGFMVGIILTAGVLVGLSTQFENAVLTALDNVILGIFVVEVVAKLSSDEKHPLTFFKDNWNVFDFVVVAGSIIPMLLRLDIASMISMLRLLRLLRVLKLVKSLPRLKIIVDALIDGFGSMFYLCVLMFLVFFLFAIVGMMLFEKNDPWHYGTLNSAMLSLFRISTLEDWTDIMFINQYGCDAYGWQVYPALSPCAPRPMGWWSVLYHVVFTVLSSMVLLTTFLGVVVTSMDKASSAQRSEARLAEQMKDLSEKKGMSIASLKILKGAFKLIDIDDGGDIDVDEVFPLLTALCPAATSDQLANLFLAVDSDSSGAIEFDEFVELLLLLRQVTEGGPGALDRFNEPPGKGAAAAAAPPPLPAPSASLPTGGELDDGVVLGYIETLKASIKALEAHLQWVPEDNSIMEETKEETQKNVQSLHYFGDGATVLNSGMGKNRNRATPRVLRSTQMDGSMNSSSEIGITFFGQIARSNSQKRMGSNLSNSNAPPGMLSRGPSQRLKPSLSRGNSRRIVPLDTDRTEVDEYDLPAGIKDDQERKLTESYAAKRREEAASSPRHKKFATTSQRQSSIIVQDDAVAGDRTGLVSYGGDETNDTERSVLSSTRNSLARLNPIVRKRGNSSAKYPPGDDL